jgi:hypothetical protein
MLTRALLLASLFWWVAFPAIAQEVRATIGGRVTDPQGSAVPGAAVTLVSEDTNVK